MYMYAYRRYLLMYAPELRLPSLWITHFDTPLAAAKPDAPPIRSHLPQRAWRFPISPHCYPTHSTSG